MTQSWDKLCGDSSQLSQVSLSGNVYGGFVLNPEKWSLDVNKGDGPIMLPIRVCAKSTKAEEVVRMFSAVSGSSNPGVLTSIVCLPEPEAQPNRTRLSLSRFAPPMQTFSCT